MDHIEELKLTKRRLLEDIQTLEKAADDNAIKAENARHITLIIKSNSLRKSAKEKREELDKLDKEVGQKLIDIKNS